ncbi:SAM-dependent methyltransferase [Microbacterium sp. A93]|uniref:SAM-dependent methyltransferase n=1 Tax=Microbacterium sp. A93 TaxID=3450716 RepID=UPI003F44104B
MNTHHEPAGTHDFDHAYWESHWAAGGTGEDDAGQDLPVSPYLPAEAGSLAPGTALDAGCGVGTEALWLADRGWQVTGADLSATALAQAARRAHAAGLDDRVEWVEADLTRWGSGRTWDLVATHYAHPDSGQLDFYEHLGGLVAPAGTLLIVGHRHGGHSGHSGHGGPAGHGSHGGGSGGGHPEGATASLEGITGLFAGPAWSVEAAYENERSIQRGDRDLTLQDVVVRVRRS